MATRTRLIVTLIPTLPVLLFMWRSEIYLCILSMNGLNFKVSSADRLLVVFIYLFFIYLRCSQFCGLSKEQDNISSE